MAKKKNIEGVFVSKKIIIIAVVVIVLLVLAAIFFFKGNIFKPAGKAEIKSSAEASERLTNVAEDITGLRDELNSISKSFSAP